MSLIHPNRVVPPLKFEFYTEVYLSAGATYTPTAPGLYHAGGNLPFSVGYFRPLYGYEKISTRDTYIRATYGTFISDGAKLNFYNAYTAGGNLLLMRSGYSKPNPSPKVGRQTILGKPCIVLESDEKGFVWILEEDLTKSCENLFDEVKEAKEKGKPHPLIGKTLIEAIKENAKPEMGWGKYRDLLKKLGYDV